MSTVTAPRLAPSIPFDAILTASHQHTGSLRRPFFVQWYEQAMVTRNYVAALWRTVVLGCLKPVNWDYCFPLDRWLVPYLDDLQKFYAEPPYAAEREILDARGG